MFGFTIRFLMVGLSSKGFQSVGGFGGSSGFEANPPLGIQ